jgi:putative oxidoreductase
MSRYLNPLSRALVAAIFLVSGFGKLANFQQMAAIGASAGLPVPSVSIALAAVVELAGGLALLLGWQVRWASLALLLFLIPTTLLFHAANLGNPAQAQMQMVEVLKNLAIMGGLLNFYADASSSASKKIEQSRGQLADSRGRWGNVA